MVSYTVADVKSVVEPFFKKTSALYATEDFERLVSEWCDVLNEEAAGFVAARDFYVSKFLKSQSLSGSSTARASVESVFNDYAVTLDFSFAWFKNNSARKRDFLKTLPRDFDKSSIVELRHRFVEECGITVEKLIECNVSFMEASFVLGRSYDSVAKKLRALGYEPLKPEGIFDDESVREAALLFFENFFVSVDNFVTLFNNGVVSVSAAKNFFSSTTGVDLHVSTFKKFVTDNSEVEWDSSRGAVSAAESVFVEKLKEALSLSDDDVETQYEFSESSKQSVDIYVPSLSLAVEFNGDRWHSDEFVEKTRGVTADEAHTAKRDELASLGVKLVYVWESDWNARPDDVLSAIVSGAYDSEILSKTALA